MAKKISHIILIFSFTLALGHSFVPHDHDSTAYETTMAAIPQQQTNAWILLLRTIFSQDLGANHLEDYNARDLMLDMVTLFTADFIYTLFSIVFSQPEDTSASYLVRNTLLPSTEYIFSTRSLRAPPLA